LHFFLNVFLLLAPQEPGFMVIPDPFIPLKALFLGLTCQGQLEVASSQKLVYIPINLA
jgi:hypothetical protein